MEILKTIIEGIKNFITCVIGIIAMPIIVFWPIWLLVIIGFVFDRCSSDNSKQKPKTEHVITSSIVSDEDDEEDEEGETYENNGFDDGTYLATVDYFNPETAFSQGAFYQAFSDFSSYPPDNVGLHPIFHCML